MRQTRRRARQKRACVTEVANAVTGGVHVRRRLGNKRCGHLSGMAVGTLSENDVPVNRGSNSLVSVWCGSPVHSYLLRLGTLFVSLPG